MTNEKQNTTCNDKLCPFHGQISTRGRNFEGKVIKKFPKRVVIEFDRTLFVQKYERYSKRKTKLHARLPDCLKDKINIGDYIEIAECRPISKIIHFIAVRNLSNIPEHHSKLKNKENFEGIKKINTGEEQ